MKRPLSPFDNSTPFNHEQAQPQPQPQPQTLPRYITILTEATQRPVGKVIGVGPDGKPMADASVNVAVWMARTIEITSLEQLAEIIRHQSSINAIILDYIPDTTLTDYYWLVSKKAMQERWQPPADAVRQIHQLTKKNFLAGGVCVFDYDFDANRPPNLQHASYDEWWADLCEVVPQLAGRGRLVVPSSKSQVVWSESGEPVYSSPSVHTYMLVENRKYIERVGTTIDARMWLAGRGYVRTGKAGQPLKRTTFDPCTFSISRRVFESNPVVSDERLKVLPKQVQVIEGPPLDLESLPELDAAEKSQYRELTDRNIKYEHAGGRMTAYAEDEGLRLDMVIETEDGTMTVQEIVDRYQADRVHLRCQTPYRESLSMAAYIGWHTDGQPFLFDVGGPSKHMLVDADRFKLEVSTGQLAALTEGMSGEFIPGSTPPSVPAGGDAFQTLQQQVSLLTPGDSVALDGFIERLADIRMSPTQEEMILQEIRDQMKIGIKPIRDHLGKAKRSRQAIRNAESRAQALAAQPRVLSVPLLRAEPGEITYPFIEGKDDPEARGICHTANLQTLCRHYGIGIWHNLMSHEIDIIIPGASFLLDEKKNLQMIALKDIALASNMTIDRMDQMVLAMACANPYHPMESWLRGNGDAHWDGIRRFPDLVRTVTTPHVELFAKILHAWMCQVIVAVRGAYGYRVPRDVLVFSGPQRIGKTSWFRYLIPLGQFGEGLHLNPHEKDSLIKAVKYTAVELGELDATFRKADIAALKAHISSPWDEVRLPYAKDTSKWQRRTSYCGTVNDEEFLVDQTGNSRWRVIRAEKFDLNTMFHWQQDGTLWQLWKEIEADVDAGAKWWLDDDTQIAMLDHTEQFRKVSDVEQLIEDAFQWDAPENLWKPMTTSEIGRGLELTPRGNGTYGFTPILKRLTGQPGPHRHDGKKVWSMPPFSTWWILRNGLKT